MELPSSHPGSAGARIYILGADNPDSLRGMYLDGVVLDEYGQMKESMWSEILRPALADREGWAVFVGTPKGQNGFYKKWMEAQGNEGWYAVRYKASETGLFPPKELEDMRRTMSDVEYAQEMECDFQSLQKIRSLAATTSRPLASGHIVRWMWSAALASWASMSPALAATGPSLLYAVASS